MAAKTQTKALMIYLNNRVVLEALDDADRGRLTLALLDYLEYGSLPAFDGALGMAFLVLQKDVDRSVERWEEECARRSAAGKKSAAVRAAKKFGIDVSCENDVSAVIPCEEDLIDDEAEAAAMNSYETETETLRFEEDCSSVFNSAAKPAGASTNTNTKSKSKSNPKSKSHTQISPPLRTDAAMESGTASLSKELTGPDCAAPRRGRGTDFERFWTAYPRKVGKQAARKAFERANVPVERLLAALERQRGEPQWQRENGRFIPHPVTWLTQGRWEDEPAMPAPQDCAAFGVESL